MKSNTGAVRLKTHKIGVWWKVKYIRGGGARGSNRCQLVQFPEQSGKLAEVLHQRGSANCPQQQGLNVDEVLDLRLLLQEGIFEKYEKFVERIQITFQIPLG